MSKIVITGGAGFIGSHIAENLAKDGHEIVIVDNLDPYYSVDLKKKNLNIALNSGDATFINADVTDLSGIKDVIDSTVDYVYHEAAQAGVRISVEDPFKPNDVNVHGTLNVLKASLDAGVKKGHQCFLIFRLRQSKIPALRRTAPNRASIPIRRQ